MSNSNGDHSYCNVNPAADSIVPAAVSTSATDNHQFYIKITTEIIHLPEPEDDDDDELPDYMNMECDTRDMEICIPVDELYGTGPHTSWSIISRHLNRVGLPGHVQQMMFDQISPCAEKMASADENVGRTVLPISVFVSYVADDGDDYRAAAEEYTIDDDFVTEGASESAVERLEKVRVEELNVNCAICLEGMEIGMEGSKMECKHFFHGDCIVEWLRVSNFCPLCRFQLPTHDP